MRTRSQRSAPSSSRLRRAVRLLWLGCAAAVLSAACGDIEDDEDPQVQCETWERTFCNKFVGCMVEEGVLRSAERSASVGECIGELEAVVDCATAVGVASKYPQCLDDIQSPPCDFVLSRVESGNALPSSCNDVIIVDR